ncbi:MAG: hypothetical protein H7317_17925 [Pseudorhodobacter sp.]|nr:hypothetical protein [Pseudorhodobacter sp.]
MMQVQQPGAKKWVMVADIAASGAWSQGETGAENRTGAIVALQKDGRAGMSGPLLKPVLVPMKRVNFRRRQVKK